MVCESASGFLLIETPACTKVSNFGVEIVADQNVFGLHVAVQQCFSTWLLVVKVPEARCDTERDRVERMRPIVVEFVRGRGNKKVLQRPTLTKLENQTELVGPIRPAPTHESNKVGVGQPVNTQWNPHVN